jgi:hypothetical protein
MKAHLAVSIGYLTAALMMGLLTYSPPAAAEEFRWLQTPQNCSIWARANFSLDNLLKISSCKDGKVYGEVVLKSDTKTSNPRTTDVHYFYDGFLVSSSKGMFYDSDMARECFELFETIKPKLHAAPGFWTPLLYVGEISSFSNNELNSNFGAKATIWMQLSTGIPTVYKLGIIEATGLCDEGWHLKTAGVISKFPFASLYKILVFKQSSSKFEDISADMIQLLSTVVIDLAFIKYENYIGKDKFYKLSQVDITDDNLNNTYASVFIGLNDYGNFFIRQIKNYVQEEKTAERAKQQEAERKLQIKAKFNDFLQQTGSSMLARVEELQSNPFRYEGVNIAVLARYVAMLDRNTGIFKLKNGGLLTVSGLDPRHSIMSGVMVVLAGKVTGTAQVPTPFGGSITAPLLSFSGVHVCQMNDCADIIPDQGQAADVAPNQTPSLPSSGAELIDVRRAIYGTPEVNRICDATEQVAAICNNTANCSFMPTNNFCGDPHFGTKKKMVVNYQCKGSTFHAIGAEGENITIICR